MSVMYIEGGHPLEGVVKPSGSKDSAIKVIIASLFSNEDVVLENIPKTNDIETMIDIVTSIGGSIKWIADNKLLINGQGINTHIVPDEIGGKSRFTLLLAGPLLFRFRKAELPKKIVKDVPVQPVNRWVDSWEAMGIKVVNEKTKIILEAENFKGANINFKISTHTGTANAILTATIIPEETFINNAAEETEVDDLLDFINLIGGEAERVEPRRIRIVGKNIFKGCYFEVQPDNIEAIAFVTGALITKGNVTINGIKKLQLTSYVNFLTKIGARYEYNRDSLNVWYGGEEFSPAIIESSPAPGFLADWLPYATLLLVYTNGRSKVHNTVYVDRFGYIQDFNRMGADIELVRPSEEGIQCAISDETYDYANLGEPKTLAVVKGPSKLKGARLNMDDCRFDSTLVIAALSADGKSELIGVDNMIVTHERFFEKLSKLGARIINPS